MTAQDRTPLSGRLDGISVVPAKIRDTLDSGMLGKVQSLAPQLLARRCVECGYDGPLLRNGHAENCARCGCDLRQRPAMSYAEMEGFVLSPSRFNPKTIWPGQKPQLRRRWAAFLFFCAVMVGAIACLSVAALASV